MGSKPGEVKRVFPKVKVKLNHHFLSHSIPGFQVTRAPFWDHRGFPFWGEKPQTFPFGGNFHRSFSSEPAFFFSPDTWHIFASLMFSFLNFNFFPGGINGGLGNLSFKPKGIKPSLFLTILGGGFFQIPGGFWSPKGGFPLKPGGFSQLRPGFLPPKGLRSR